MNGSARPTAQGLTFVRWVVFAGLAASLAFVLAFLRGASAIEQPGVGSLGLDPCPISSLG